MCENHRTPLPDAKNPKAMLPDAKNPKAMLPDAKNPKTRLPGAKKPEGFRAHRDQYTTNAGFYKVIDKKMTSMTGEAWYKWVR